MGPEEFRAAGHELIDWIADYRARIPALPVQARTKPGEVAGQLPPRAPEEAEPFARLLADLDAIVVPGVTQVQHPRYFGWFPANATLSSALAGYGRDNLRLVAVDPVTYAMRPDALAKALEEDVKAGRRPAAVVVNVGTTGTTAVDPLAQIVPLAQRYGMWVHVDAAMAGSALLLPEMRWLVDGVEGADSLCWNPHKWMGTVLDCSLLYVADPAHLIRVMSTNPSYLRSAVDGEVTQYKDWGIPLGRRFRALKLWFQLRLDGVEAIRARLRRDLENARWLAGQVSSTPGWRVLAPVNLQTVVLRHEPQGTVSAAGAVLDADALNAHTLAWA